MPDFDVKEKRFEQDIEEYLTTAGGYQKGNPKTFDREKALDVGTFVSFIRTSQPKAWERFEKIYGADSERQIVERFCREVKMVGLLKVLRQGFTDRGIKFRAVFWKPETRINETTQAQYAANILHCTRQLHYSLHNENSIDIVLFVNGIPVVSMELKCQFTGQDTACYQAHDRQRGHTFSRAGFSDDSQGFPCLDIKTDAVHRFYQAVICFEIGAEIFYLQQGFVFFIHKRYSIFHICRNPSPKILIPMTKIAMARAGNVAIHQPSLK